MGYVINIAYVVCVIYGLGWVRGVRFICGVCWVGCCVLYGYV